MAPYLFVLKAAAVIRKICSWGMTAARHRSRLMHGMRITHN